MATYSDTPQRLQRAFCLMRLLQKCWHSKRSTETGSYAAVVSATPKSDKLKEASGVAKGMQAIDQGGNSANVKEGEV